MVVREIRREVSKNQWVFLHETLNHFELILVSCFRKVILILLKTIYWKQINIGKKEFG